MTSTLYLNVTTSANWSRPPVGIVRVEIEIAKYLLQYSLHRFLLCEWSPHKQCFTLADKYLYAEKVGISFIGEAVLPPSAGDQEVSFFSSDILISAGLDWDINLPVHLMKIKEKTGLKIIGCCYDLIPVKYPQYCVGDVAKFFGEYFLTLSSIADHIACISRSSQSDLIHFLDSAGMPFIPNTSVFTLGDTIQEVSQAKNNPERPSFLPFTTPYILFVSTIERRKNHILVYQAIRSIYEEHFLELEDIPNVVFVGMKGWGVEELLSDLSLDPDIGSKFYIYDHVSDSDLSSLYANCLFTVYPSYYEGWGLPVAESLCYGKPVICSNKSSLPEVAGDLAIYVDPYSAKELAEKITSLVKDSCSLEALEKRIKSSYKPRSWLDSGKQISAIVSALKEAKVGHRRLLQCGYDMSSLVGAHCGSCIFISPGSSGYLLFGPHLNLDPCSFSVRIKYKSRNQSFFAGKIIIRSSDFVLHEQVMLAQRGDKSAEEKSLDSNTPEHVLLIESINNPCKSTDVELVLIASDVFCNALLMEVEFIFSPLNPLYSPDQLIGSLQMLIENKKPVLPKINQLIQAGQYTAAEKALELSSANLTKLTYESKKQEIIRRRSKSSSF
jgi:glycosyltransferase involved in cell wall biosynthesis